MAATTHAKWFVRLVIPAALGAGTLYWVLAREGVHEAKTTQKSEAPAAKAAQAGGSRMAEAVKLSSARGLDSTAKMAEAYAGWASDPNALPARKLLLSTLFAEKDIAKKLNGVLAAVEADPTPVERDPLWDHIATELSALWKGDVATKAMDLVMAEVRPRARRALISSFARLATSERLGELTNEQRQTLTETMIDVTPHAPASQKQELDAALRKLGGNDLADIMAGKGLTGQDGHVLESERAYHEALEQTQRELAQANDAAD